MTLETAIEILKELDIDHWRALPPDKQEAVNLGIEALKAIIVDEYRGTEVPRPLLPGETKD